MPLFPAHYVTISNFSSTGLNFQLWYIHFLWYKAGTFPCNIEIFEWAKLDTRVCSFYTSWSNSVDIASLKFVHICLISKALKFRACDITPEHINILFICSGGTWLFVKWISNWNLMKWCLTSNYPTVKRVMF